MLFGAAALAAATVATTTATRNSNSNASNNNSRNKGERASNKVVRSRESWHAPAYTGQTMYKHTKIHTYIRQTNKQIDKRTFYECPRHFAQARWRVGPQAASKPFCIVTRFRGSRRPKKHPKES